MLATAAAAIHSVSPASAAFALTAAVLSASPALANFVNSPASCQIPHIYEMKRESLLLSLVLFLLCSVIILVVHEESNIAEDDQKYVEERIKRERQNITIYFMKSEFYYL